MVRHVLLVLFLTACSNSSTEDRFFKGDPVDASLVDADMTPPIDAFVADASMDAEVCGPLCPEQTSKQSCMRIFLALAYQADSCPGDTPVTLPCSCDDATGLAPGETTCKVESCFNG